LLSVSSQNEAYKSQKLYLLTEDFLTYIK